MSAQTRNSAQLSYTDDQYRFTTVSYDNWIKLCEIIREYGGGFWIVAKEHQQKMTPTLCFSNDTIGQTVIF